MAQIDLEQLAQFDASWTLIPLFKWDHTSERNGKPRKDGKRPMHKDWTTRAYDRDTVLEAASRGHNIGVRLPAEWVVVDVDPRNMPEGRDTFDELCAATGMNPDDYPHVRTGSGGRHIYMRKPKDTVLVDSLDGYEGVEFKSLGRQVVAPGSIHPETGEHYRWESWLVGLEDMPVAPQRLLDLAVRPMRSDQVDTTAGTHTQQEVAEMLDQLDPEDYQDQTRWLELMMACHHASGGMARDEFTEWSTRDPRYQNDAWIIGRRWDSLHANKRSSITVRTLYKALHDRGRGGAIPASAMGDDEFEQALEDEKRPENDDRSPLERMNDQFVMTTVGGKTRIFHHHQPYERPPVWEALTVPDFLNRYSSMQAIKKTPKGPTRVSLAKEWLNWPKRRDAKSVCFIPMKDTPGHLNMWSGWGVEPKPGSWSYLRDLIENTLCAGEPEAAEYTIKWMAYMVQKPWLPAETAICFHGAKGTGKSTLGHILTALAGPSHGMTVVTTEQFAGRFNGHMQDKVFLFADEAVSPTDRDAQERLKTMITSPVLAYERKGIDLTSGRNCLHIMICSNHDWFVNMSLTDGERRYMVCRVSDNRQGDHEFWDALYRQMYEEGGLQALMHDLRAMDLGRWVPRLNVPNTSAMDDQKIQNMQPIQKWWFETLWSGRLGVDTTREDEDDWTQGPVRVFREVLRDSYSDWAKHEGIRGAASNRGLAQVFWKELEKVTGPLREFRDVVPPSSLAEPQRDGRAKCVELGSLEDMRRRFDEAAGTSTKWEAA